MVDFVKARKGKGIRELLDLLEEESGYKFIKKSFERSPSRNKKVGGSDKSYHLEKDKAADFQAVNKKGDPLSKEETNRLKRLARRLGISFLDETQSTKGTGSHFHVDLRHKGDSNKNQEPSIGRLVNKKFKQTKEDLELQKLADMELGAMQKRESKMFPQKDYGEKFGPSLEELQGEDSPNLADRLIKEDSPILSMIEEANKHTNYSDLPFREAFEKAMKEKGEGQTFDWKGKKFLLERAKEEKPISEKLKEYSDNMDDIVKEELSVKPTLEETLKPYSDSMDDVVASEIESMKDFDPSKLQLQKLESLREDYMPRKEDMYKDGGAKYQDGTDPLEKMLQDLREARGETTSQESPVLDMVNQANVKEITEAPKLEEEPVGNRSVGSEGMEKGQEQVDKDYKTSESIPSKTEPPKVEEPQEAPMTMESLEKEYRKLMKASESERKTAAWATAATQIASMLDKFSAVPVGIKPINFEAQVNPVQMKELMELGKFKGLGRQQGMTEYQKASLEERRKDRELAEKKLEAALKKAPEESLTEAQKSLDREYGKEYADYIAAGGSKTVESDLGKLNDIFKEMQENKDMFSGPLDKSVEYLGGFDTIRAAVNPRLQDIKSRLEQIIQQDLRTTLGAQFTEKEGKQFLERSFDPKLGYEQNKKRLEDFISMVKSRAEARKKAAQYFEDKGTLKGFKGTEGSTSTAEEPSAKRLVKKQYSQSRNQTKLVYSDGSEEIVDGRQ